MTNREMIMKELEAMTDEKLESVIYGDEADRLDRIKHSDCFVKHNFECPGGPNTCVTDMCEWFGWECTHMKLLERIEE